MQIRLQFANRETAYEAYREMYDELLRKRCNFVSIKGNDFRYNSHFLLEVPNYLTLKFIISLTVFYPDEIYVYADENLLLNLPAFEQFLRYHRLPVFLVQGFPKNGLLPL